jgi:prepilin-type processing-associated H-X9-DG protein
MLSSRALFTMIELLVVIAVIMILVSLLSPSLRKARDMAMAMHCVNNQKQIGATFQFYAGDYGGYFPNWQWQTSLTPYIPNAEGKSLVPIGMCPSAPQKMPSGSYKDAPLCSHYIYTGVYYDSRLYFACYGKNYFISEAKIRNPSSKVVIMEGWWPPNIFGSVWGTNVISTISTTSHGSGANILFVDNHAQWHNYRSAAGQAVDIAGEHIISADQLYPCK